MGFKEDFVAYAEKIETPEDLIWKGYAELKRIPYVLMGVIPNVHIKEPEYFSAEDIEIWRTLYKKVQHHAYVHFRTSNRSLKSMRRAILRTLQKEANKQQ